MKTGRRRGIMPRVVVRDSEVHLRLPSFASHIPTTNSTMKRKIPLALLGIVVLGSFTILSAKDWRSGIPWLAPPIVTPGEKPGDAPSDAIILFDGKNLGAWEKPLWDVADGVMTVKPKGGTMSTKQRFGSVQLHLEFATPTEVDPKRTGQARGNSGVFFGPYEVQILDSHENVTYFDGQCASFYKQRPPLVNVCRRPGEWQTYDIVFNRPELKIEDGKVVEVIRPGYVTVFQNGILVLNHHEIEGTGFWHQAPFYEAHAPLLPIRLQDHGDPVKFRNIWVREIPDDTKAKPAPTREPYFQEDEPK